MTTDRGAQDIGPARRGVDWAGIVIAIALAVLAVVIVVDAMRIQATVTYGMGPQAVPILIAIGLGVLAIGNLINALRGDYPEREDMDFRPVGLVLAGLAAMIAIIGLGGGFIPAMTVLFAATATAFGRRAILTDLVIGFVIGTIIYLAFSRLLTLSLPAGPLERLF
jgi:putative tricarboxylic transport membrane protein